MNKKVPIEYAAGWMRQVRVQELVPETVEAVLLQAETGMTEEENADKLAKIFDVDDFCYLKGKAACDAVDEMAARLKTSLCDIRRIQLHIQKPDEVVEKVRFIVNGSKHGYRPHLLRTGLYARRSI